MKKKLFLILIMPALVLVGAWFLRDALATSNPHTWTSSLVGYWNFDGQNTTSTNGTRDTSGNNNWGAFNNGVKPAAGISGQALSFDGLNDFVRAGTSASLDITTGDLTIELWVYLNTQTEDYSIIIGKGATGASLAGYTMDSAALPSNQRRICISDGEGAPAGDNYQCSPSTTALTDGNWHHFVGYVDRTAAKIGIYLDGKFIGANNIPVTLGSISNSARNLDIGGAGASYSFNGKIDELRIYSRALSAEEVMQHYQQTRRNLKL